MPLFAALALAAMLQKPAPKDPYAGDIARFKAMDHKHRPALGQILFIGSSSFTRWTDVQDYFPGYHILNRAFGGSTLLDQIAHVKDMVLPYKPKQIVIYCGENDFAYDSTLSVTSAVGRFKTLFQLIRTGLPGVPIAYVSMKPSLNRWSLRGKFQAADGYIKYFLSLQKKTDFVDVWDLMLSPSGWPQPNIFGPDRLHMNALGYRLWKPLIQTVLLK